MQDNLAGQLTILKSQLEELAISCGEMLMPTIRQIVSWIQSFVDKLNSMDEGTRKVIITIALVAAFIYLWNNCEEFRQFWIDLWENIKEIAVAVWNGLKDFFQKAWEAIKNTASTVWNGIKDFFSGL